MAWNKSLVRAYPQAVDTMLPFLATSRDGLSWNWQWVYGRAPLPVAKGTGFNYIQAAHQFLTWGGFHWIFYSGNPQGHEKRWKGHEEIWMARYVQNRMIGLKTRGQSGHVISKLFWWSDDVISLNVDLVVGNNSFCRVFVLGSDGFEFKLADILESRSDGPVCINVSTQRPQRTTSSDVGGHNVQLRFDMAGHVRLYAFSLLYSGHDGGLGQ